MRFSVAFPYPCHSGRGGGILAGVLCVAVAAVTLPAVAQTAATPRAEDVAGWINGKPVAAKNVSENVIAGRDSFFFQHRRAPTADDEPELVRLREKGVCNRWQSQFEAAAEDDAIERFAISATEEEIRATRASMFKSMDLAKEAERTRDKGIRLRAALNEVHLLKKDPQTVFDSSLKDHGFQPKEWEMYVAMGVDESRRLKLTEWMINTTQAQLEAAKARMDVDRLVKLAKLKARVLAEARAAQNCLRVLTQWPK